MTTSELTLLARKIYQVSHLTGHFNLRLGGTSNEFFDNFLFLADPVLLHEMAQAMLPLIPSEAEVICGPELAGVPLVTMLAHLTGLPMAWVRKEAKTYGTCRLIEGTDVSGRQVVMVEAMFKTGTFALNICQELQKLTARVTVALCVIDWDRGSSALLAEHGIEKRSLFTYKQVEAAGKGIVQSV